MDYLNNWVALYTKASGKRKEACLNEGKMYMCVYVCAFHLHGKDSSNNRVDILGHSNTNSTTKTIRKKAMQVWKKNTLAIHIWGLQEKFIQKMPSKM